MALKDRKPVVVVAGAVALAIAAIVTWRTASLARGQNRLEPIPQPPQLRLSSEGAGTLKDRLAARRRASGEPLGS